MPVEQAPLHNFNTGTMSGIYPGSRTMVYQRLYLQPKKQSKETPLQWYQLQWYDEPRAAMLLQLQANKPTTAPLFTLNNPTHNTFTRELHKNLEQAELEADACYICKHWQPLSVHTDDGLPAGRCAWNNSDATLPSALSTQSALSLACENFSRLDQPLPNQTETSTPSTHHPRVPKLAELDPDRLAFWPRLWHRLNHRLDQRKKPAQHWADQVLERSGVGAGTEPCFVCQGRLANLGALAVASPEGDKQTLSVWRCRSCYTTYFNDWTDRWERLDNLETEERYFRIAPAEAYAALSVIHATKGGDHPGRREDRRQQRAQMLALLTGKRPLSHQVRQGR